ncbi:MAG: putative quinol monooxygenase [Rhodoblastus sp.]
MIAVVAFIKTKPGQGAEFEAVARELAAKVNADEPGCKLYQLSKASEPDTYVFMERYVDQSAVDAHRASAHFRELGKKMGAFMDGRPDVKVMQEV